MKQPSLPKKRNRLRVCLYFKKNPSVKSKEIVIANDFFSRYSMIVESEKHDRLIPVEDQGSRSYEHSADTVSEFDTFLHTTDNTTPDRKNARQVDTP